jgi:hypothetical protein
MRTVGFATLALTLAACSAEPLGHQWQVDKDGRPVPGTERAVWTEDEALELRQQGLTFNVGYNLDCGINRNPFSGEVLLFDGTNYTAECNAIRVEGGATNPPHNLIISFDDPTARWSSGKSWNDQVSSMKAKEQGFVQGPNFSIGMCIRFRQSILGGDTPGWGSALFGMGPDGTLNLPSMFPFGDASLIVVRAKGQNETGCPL